jgi:hypothetical protein
MASEHLAHLRGWAAALRASGVPIDALPERMGLKIEEVLWLLPTADVMAYGEWCRTERDRLMASLPGRLPGS